MLGPAGTDNGGGNWVLTPDQLSGLTMTAADDGVFGLTVTVIESRAGAPSVSVTETVIVCVPTLRTAAAEPQPFRRCRCRPSRAPTWRR